MRGGTFELMFGRLCLATLALTAVAAPAQAARPSPPQPPREIQFSGHTWLVKDSGGAKWGPGPNVFSPSTDNVWVDALGRLHLHGFLSGATAWTFADAAAVPRAGGENTRMNLWLFRGRAPSNRLPAEVVFERFEHVP